MKKFNLDMTRFAVLIAAVLAVAVLLSFGKGIFFGRDTPAVLLPDISESPGVSADPNAPPTGSGADDPVEVEVTPETVQAVVATLARPESYSCTIQETTYWSGGSGTRQIQVWADGACCATRTETETLARRSLTNGNTLWLWYEGEEDLYEGPLAENTPDDLSGIPTYEDLLGLEKDRILSAGYEGKNGWACVWAETEPGEDGTTARYWISVENGLLVAAELRRDGTLTYAVSLPSVQIPVTDETAFRLPDGTDVRE